MEFFLYSIFVLFVIVSVFNIWANRTPETTPSTPDKEQLKRHKEFEQKKAKFEIEKLKNKDIEDNKRKKELIINNAIAHSPFRARSYQKGSGDESRLIEIHKNEDNTEKYTLYLVKIRSVIDGKLYLKAGVSKYTDISERFSDDETVELIEICNSVSLPKYIALRLEFHIINAYRPTPYADKEFDIYSRFSGYTEVLDIRFIKEIREGYDSLLSWNSRLKQELEGVKKKAKTDLQLDLEIRQTAIRKTNT